MLTEERNRRMTETGPGTPGGDFLRRYWYPIAGTVELEDEPAYTAIYELASPEVLVSDAWGAAVEQGRWPGHVRPHTTNRRHVLLERTR